MLPEPSLPRASPAMLPELPLRSADLDALPPERARARGGQRARSPPIVAGGIEPVPANVTPRGSIVAISAVQAEAPQVLVHEDPVATDASVGGCTEVQTEVQNQLLSRAERAEQEVRKLRMENKKLEGEVRKLRADAYFQRIGKNLHPLRGIAAEKIKDDCERSPADPEVGDAFAARLLAEERAVQAETEVLRLHTELQAARIQFALISDQSTTSAPPPEALKGTEVDDYEVLTCLRHMCGCLRFFLVRIFLAIFCCFHSRSTRLHKKMESGHDEVQDVPVRTFIVDRA